MRAQRIALVVTSTLVAAAGLQAPADGQEGSERRPPAGLLAGAVEEPAAGSGPIATAREHLREHSTVNVDRLDLLRTTRLAGTSSSYAVLFRQRFPHPAAERRASGSRASAGKRWLRAGAGGLISVAVRGNRVVHTSSSSFGGRYATVNAPIRLTPRQAWRKAAQREGRQAVPARTSPARSGSGRPESARPESGHPKSGRPGAGRSTGAWTTFRVPGFSGVQRARLVAVPGPRGEVRPAFEANVVDVEDGDALAVTSYVDAETGRVLIRHDRVRHLDGAGPEKAGPEKKTGLQDAHLEGGRLEGAGFGAAPVRGCPSVVPGCGFRLDHLDPGPILALLYDVGTAYPADLVKSDGWRRADCDVKRFGAHARAVEAAVTTTDDLDNRLHDWAYDLGFTPRTYNLQDSDPIVAQIHVGALDGGFPTYSGRNNAYQVTLQDGLAAQSGISLYQPVAGTWHGPCVDGALDPTVVAHEYAHGVVERMVAGPDLGVSSREGLAVSESWADLLAVQFMSDTGRPTRVIGAHVGGDRERGTRMYALDDNPLGFADYGRDPLLDREIWSGIGSDLREAIGGRMFTRLLFDSFLLQQPGVTMTGARDALLAADRLRTGGANARALWHVFAQRGLGSGAAPGHPSYRSPLEESGRLVVDGPAGLRISVGRSAAGAALRRPEFVPGSYDISWSAPGHGFGRTTMSIEPGATTRMTIDPARNLASGRTPLTDGRPDTTATTRSDSFVVDLAGTEPRRVRRITIAGPGRPGPAAFDAVRRFAVDACTTRARPSEVLGDGIGDRIEDGIGAGIGGDLGEQIGEPPPALPRPATRDCRRVFTSEGAAFDAGRPYPRASDLEPRSFDLPGRPYATQLRVVVGRTQCSGNPAYTGEQESDRLSPSDCGTSRRAETASLGEIMAGD